VIYRLKTGIKKLKHRPGIRLSAGKLIAGALSACWLLLLVREIDKSEFATVVLVLAFSSLTSVLHDGGQLVLLAKVVAIHPDIADELSSLVFRRRLALATLALLFVTIAFSAVTEASILVVLLIWPSVLATVGYSTIFTVLRVNGAVDLEAKNELFSRLALIIFGLVMIYWGLSATRVIGLYSVIDILSLVIVYRKHGKSLATKPRLQSRIYAREELHWRVSAIISITGATGLLFAKIDPIFVSALRNEEDVATFSIGIRFVEFLIVPVGTLIILKISNFARSNSLTEVFKTVKVVMAYALAAVGVLQIVASLLPVVFGLSYADAVAPMRILALSVFPMSIGSVFIAWLTLKQPNRALISLAIGLSSNVFAHILVTSKFGPTGAACVNFIANSIMALVAFMFFRRLNQKISAS
jgi:O-antigen/teichoic acid export membrane protein